MLEKVGKVFIRNGRDKSLRKFHPWVFSGAIAKAIAKPGDIVDIFDSNNTFLARGYFNNKATIACRVLTWQEEEINQAFFVAKFNQALAKRAAFLDQTNAYRLIFSEPDSLPGLIVDIYDKVAVIQISTLGLEAWREVIVEALKQVLPLEGIYEKSEGDSREVEGLKPHSGLLWGKVPEMVNIQEQGIVYAVDIIGGQKTGFFLDQRANREAVEAYVQGKTVLNTFSYTGGFSIHAALAGATSVISIDSSAQALDIAKTNAKLNKVETICDYECVDVFEYLKQTERHFDVIILDPPGFVKSKKDLQAGTNAYRVLYQLALKRLNPGGILITASCSGWVDRALFHKIAFWACEKQGVQLALVEERGHTWDHPISVFFPEGEYLKFAVYQRDSRL